MTTNPAPRDRLRLGELTRDELRERLPRATVVLPLGSTEQHGPHLPLLTDSLMVEAVAARGAALAAASIDVLLGPLLPYGCSHHHLPVGGALSVSQRTYIALIADLAESLTTVGARRLVLLNGHGGNEDALRVVASEIVNERRLDLAVAAASYWTVGREALGGARPGPVPGHAGNFETSGILALYPDLVQLERRFPAEDRPRPLYLRRQVGPIAVSLPGLWEASGGVSDTADRASAQDGETALDALARSLADFLVAFHRAADGG